MRWGNARRHCQGGFLRGRIEGPVRAGTERLRPPPYDLSDVLAPAASAAPASAALRAFMRVSRSNIASCLPLRDAAAQAGRAFLSLFNHAEVIKMVRAEFWQRVLEYSHAGGLQAVLDEYAEILRESG